MREGAGGSKRGWIGTGSTEAFCIGKRVRIESGDVGACGPLLPGSVVVRVDWGIIVVDAVAGDLPVITGTGFEDVAESLVVVVVTDDAVLALDAVIVVVGFDEVEVNIGLVVVDVVDDPKF